MKKTFAALAGCAVGIALFSGTAFSGEICIGCHKGKTPGLVKDWQESKHSKNDVTCSTCHGYKHKKASTSDQAMMPDEHVCAECHEEKFTQFTKGKHNMGWTSLNAMPITHLEPDELMEGAGGCGGCHNMGVKTAEQKQAQLDKGYRYQNNSCDECHTRHTFSKKEALNPKACQICHMGYDHPQWEMWSSSKHGARYLIREAGGLPENAPAPTCQECHMADGNHENRTAWGFLGVRLPLPEDPEWKADRITILKALGVLDPGTGEPTARLDVVKAADLVRLTEEAWSSEREKMIKTCSKCHSSNYARKRLEQGDSMMQKADRMLAEAIEVVAGLYKDSILEKPADYAFAYPDFLFFMQTGGHEGAKNGDASYIEQVLFEMYMKHRMRTYQAFFHINPDYAYWYGWAMMTKDLGEIKDLAKTMRATHKK